jgi:hypothetical protein
MKGEAATGSHARAEGAEDERESREGHGHAHRPAFFGEQPEESTEDTDKGAQRHPLNGRFRAQEEAGWPGVSQHIPAGSTQPPTALTDLHTAQGQGYAATSVSAPGEVRVAHVDYASAYPIHRSVLPIQAPPHTAPTGARA